MANGKHFKPDKDVENKMEIEEIEISTSNEDKNVIKETEERTEEEKENKKDKKSKKKKKESKAERKEEKRKSKDKDKTKSKKSTSIAVKILMTILILLFIGSLIFVGYILYDRYKNDKEEAALKSFMGNDTNNSEGNSTVQEDDGRMGKVKELQKTNKDVKGWLEIEGTTISYPLLHGQDKDVDYYIRHNWKNEYSIDGSIFLDKAYDWNKPSTNLLIYGHNNRGTKTMFVNLLKFKKEDYYKKHKYIRLTTATEDMRFEIIGAFESRVYYKREKNVFRYYFFIDAKNKEEFDDYVNNVKKASLYKTDATAEYGDQLMTLSTCDFKQEDGRFAVVAKKISSTKSEEKKENQN